VEKTVRNVKRATTKRRIGPPDEISIESPPPEAVKTFDTKYRAIPSNPERRISPRPYIQRTRFPEAERSVRPWRKTFHTSLMK
jgi:hypothetical protein